MTNETHSALTQWMAKVCVFCPVCRGARKKSSGFSYWFVKNIDSKMCPFCRAYAKVYGRQAYE